MSINKIIRDEIKIFNKILKITQIEIAIKRIMIKFDIK